MCHPAAGDSGFCMRMSRIKWPGKFFPTPATSTPSSIDAKSADIPGDVRTTSFEGKGSSDQHKFKIRVISDTKHHYCKRSSEYQQRTLDIVVFIRRRLAPLRPSCPPGQSVVHKCSLHSSLQVKQLYMYNPRPEVLWLGKKIRGNDYMCRFAAGIIWIGMRRNSTKGSLESHQIPLASRVGVSKPKLLGGWVGRGEKLANRIPLTSLQPTHMSRQQLFMMPCIKIHHSFINPISYILSSFFLNPPRQQHPPLPHQLDYPQPDRP